MVTMPDMESIARVLRYLHSTPGTQWSMRDDTTFVLESVTDQEALDAWCASLPERHIDLSSLPVLS